MFFYFLNLTASFIETNENLDLRCFDDHIEYLQKKMDEHLAERVYFSMEIRNDQKKFQNFLNDLPKQLSPYYGIDTVFMEWSYSSSSYNFYGKIQNELDQAMKATNYSRLFFHDMDQYLFQIISSAIKKSQQLNLIEKVFECFGKSKKRNNIFSRLVFSLYGKRLQSKNQDFIEKSITLLKSANVTPLQSEFFVTSLIKNVVFNRERSLFHEEITRQSSSPKWAPKHAWIAFLLNLTKLDRNLPDHLSFLTTEFNEKQALLNHFCSLYQIGNIWIQRLISNKILEFINNNEDSFSKFWKYLHENVRERSRNFSNTYLCFGVLKNEDFEKLSSLIKTINLPIIKMDRYEKIKNNRNSTQISSLESYIKEAFIEQTKFTFEPDTKPSKELYSRVINFNSESGIIIKIIDKQNLKLRLFSSNNHQNLELCQLTLHINSPISGQFIPPLQKTIDFMMKVFINPFDSGNSSNKFKTSFDDSNQTQKISYNLKSDLVNGRNFINAFLNNLFSNITTSNKIKGVYYKEIAQNNQIKFYEDLSSYCDFFEIFPSTESVTHSNQFNLIKNGNLFSKDIHILEENIIIPADINVAFISSGEILLTKPANESRCISFTKSIFNLLIEDKKDLSILEINISKMQELCKKIGKKIEYNQKFKDLLIKEIYEAFKELDRYNRICVKEKKVYFKIILKLLLFIRISAENTYGFKDTILVNDSFEFFSLIEPSLKSFIKDTV